MRAAITNRRRLLERTTACRRREKRGSVFTREVTTPP
jgi:hypothetical protein